MFEKIKKSFQKKNETFLYCFDGKVIRYLDLTQKQIDKLKEENKD